MRFSQPTVSASYGMPCNATISNRKNSPMKTALTSIALVCAVSTLAALAQNQDASKPAAPSPAQGTNNAAMSVPVADKAPVKETGTVIGKVVDSDNNPVKGAVVDVIAPRPKAKTAAGDAPKGPANVGHGRTGADGTFKFEGIPVGQYPIYAHHGGKGGGGKDSIEVKANETVDAGTITLQMRKAVDATKAK